MIARDGTPTGGAIVGWYYAVAEPVWALYPARALVALTDEAVNQRRIAAAVGRVARREGLAT